MNPPSHKSRSSSLKEMISQKTWTQMKSPFLGRLARSRTPTRGRRKEGEGDEEEEAGGKQWREGGREGGRERNMIRVLR